MMNHDHDLFRSECNCNDEHSPATAIGQDKSTESTPCDVSATAERIVYTPKRRHDCTNICVATVSTLPSLTSCTISHLQDFTNLAVMTKHLFLNLAEEQHMHIAVYDPEQLPNCDTLYFVPLKCHHTIILYATGSVKQMNRSLKRLHSEIQGFDNDVPASDLAMSVHARSHTPTLTSIGKQRVIKDTSSTSSSSSDGAPQCSTYDDGKLDTTTCSSDEVSSSNCNTCLVRPHTGANRPVSPSRAVASSVDEASAPSDTLIAPKPTLEITSSSQKVDAYVDGLSLQDYHVGDVFVRTFNIDLLQSSVLTHLTRAVTIDDIKTAIRMMVDTDKREHVMLQFASLLQQASQNKIAIASAAMSLLSFGAALMCGKPKLAIAAFSGAAASVVAASLPQLVGTAYIVTQIQNSTLGSTRVLLDQNGSPVRLLDNLSLILSKFNILSSPLAYSLIRVEDVTVKVAQDVVRILCKKNQNTKLYTDYAETAVRSMQSALGVDASDPFSETLLGSRLMAELVVNDMFYKNSLGFQTGSGMSL